LKVGIERGASVDIIFGMVVVVRETVVVVVVVMEVVLLMRCLSKVVVWI